MGGKLKGGSGIKVDDETSPAQLTPKPKSQRILVMFCFLGLHGWVTLPIRDQRFYTKGRYCWRCGRAELMDRDDGYFSHRPGLDGQLPEFINVLNSRSEQKSTKSNSKPKLTIVR